MAASGLLTKLAGNNCEENHSRRFYNPVKH